MNTNQQPRYMTDVEWRLCHAVNIYVYRNGVENQAPMLVHIPPSRKDNMRSVLQVLSERIKYPVGYAKTLFRMDGTKIFNPCELEMYNNYVVGSNNDKHFRWVQYGKRKSPLLVLNTISKHARALSNIEMNAGLRKRISTSHKYKCPQPPPPLAPNASFTRLGPKPDEKEPNYIFGGLRQNESMPFCIVTSLEPKCSKPREKVEIRAITGKDFNWNDEDFNEIQKLQQSFAWPKHQVRDISTSMTKAKIPEINYSQERIIGSRGRERQFRLKTTSLSLTDIPEKHNNNFPFV